MRSFGALAVAAALLGAGVEPAGATTYCLVKKTKDGFVALRDRPDPGGRLVQRMKAGDEVLPGEERLGPWVKVAYWRGGRFAGGKPLPKPATANGWMHSALIEEDSCG